MENHNSPILNNNTDWIPAREAADPRRTGSIHPESSLRFHCYTTGWLVCADGPERGRDWRLRFGNNRIGRDISLDVCIFEDPAIIRGTHCSVVYDEKSNTFYLVPGEGTSTFLEDRLLTEPAILTTGSRFRIGDTTLDFIAYCRENVVWR